MSIELQQITGSQLELDACDLDSLAHLYGDVFAGDPWDEWTLCPEEMQYFGRQTQPGQPCPSEQCGGVLGLAYPFEQTRAYIQAELARDQTALLLLRDTAEDTLVGFSWGFAYAGPDEFAESKYRTPAMQKAVSGILQDLGLGRNGFWYLSESGIKDDERYRGQGLSREFHRIRLDTARCLGLDALQRTIAAGAGAMYRTSRRTMEQITGVEAISDPLTRRLLPTGTIVNAIDDSEVPNRVLFAKAHEDTNY